jgi:phosphoglucomutase
MFCHGGHVISHVFLGRFIGTTDRHLVQQRRYGRNYYTRYDYESVESAKADKVMSLLESKMVCTDGC